MGWGIANQSGDHDVAVEHRAACPGLENRNVLLLGVSGLAVLTNLEADLVAFSEQAATGQNRTPIMILRALGSVLATRSTWLMFSICSDNC